VFKDENGNSESHKCKKDLDKIEDDELKDDIHEDEAGGGSHDEIEIPLCGNFLKDMEDEVICLISHNGA